MSDEDVGLGQEIPEGWETPEPEPAPEPSGILSRSLRAVARPWISTAGGIGLIASPETTEQRALEMASKETAEAPPTIPQRIGEFAGGLAGQLALTGPVAGVAGPVGAAAQFGLQSAFDSYQRAFQRALNEGKGYDEARDIAEAVAPAGAAAGVALGLALPGPTATLKQAARAGLAPGGVAAGTTVLQNLYERALGLKTPVAAGAAEAGAMMALLPVGGYAVGRALAPLLRRPAAVPEAEQARAAGLTRTAAELEKERPRLTPEEEAGVQAELEALQAEPTPEPAAAAAQPERVYAPEERSITEGRIAERVEAVPGRIPAEAGRGYRTEGGRVEQVPEAARPAQPEVVLTDAQAEAIAPELGAKWQPQPDAWRYQITEGPALGNDVTVPKGSTRAQIESAIESKQAEYEAAPETEVSRMLREAKEKPVAAPAVAEAVEDQLQYRHAGIPIPGIDEATEMVKKGVKHAVEKSIGKPQGVDTPIVLEKDSPLPDFQSHDKSKQIFSQPWGFERLPFFGWLFGGMRRMAGNVNESIVTYWAERQVGRSVGSALAQEYSWINKPFKIRDGQITNIGLTAEGQSRYISDVFEGLMRDPNAYVLDDAQRTAFNAILDLEKHFTALQKKYKIGKYTDDEGAPVGETQFSDTGDVAHDPTPYFARVVVNRPEGRGRALRPGAAVGSKAFFEKARLFDTEAEGWAKGWTYETDIARRLATRAERMYKRIADKRLAGDKSLGGITRTELDAQLKTAYANELAAGTMTEKRLSQIADSIEAQGRVWQPAFFNRIFPRDTADALNKAFPHSDSMMRKTAATLNNALKALWLGFDLGVPFIQGQVLAFRHPIVWAKTVGNSMRAMFSTSFFPEYVRRNLPYIREAAQLGSSVGRMEEMMAGMEKGELIHRVPIIKQTLGELIQPFSRQFQTFLDVAKIELWKAYREVAPKEQWPRVMQTIESILLTSRMEPVGISPKRALTERALLIAPSFYRGALNLVAAIGEKGVSGDMARKALGAYMAGGITLFVGMAKALGISWEEIQKRLDPRRSDFVMLPIKIGQRTTEVGFGGIFKSLMRLAGNSLKTAVENPGSWKSLSPEKNPFVRWYRGHAGSSVGLVWDQFTGRDYMGQDVDMLSLGRTILPMTARAALEPGQRFNLLDVAATFAGMTSFERLHPNSSEVGRLVTTWLATSPEPALRQEFERRSQLRFPESAYRPIRTALLQGDETTAATEYEKLRQTRSKADIAEAMRGTRPFTGSYELESKFRKTLTAEQRKIYDAAKQERLDLFRRFKKMLGSRVAPQ